MLSEPGSHVTVIGSGTMGAGIAQVAATGGHRVSVIDTNLDALEKARSAMDSALSKLAGKGRITTGDKVSIARRITWSSDIEAAAGSALVVEAIVERLDVKRRLFAQLEAIVSDEAVLATNTSSLSVSNIAATLAKAERFIGMHFFNPVPTMKLVEIIPGRAGGGVSEAVFALMRRWNKHPVLVADRPGFIVNRVARPYYAEAFLALSEGVEPEIIDAALTRCGGFRMGPLTLADMIGHDVNFTVASTIYEAYGDHGRFRPQQAQKALVDAGRLGRKSGRGVYDGVNSPGRPAIVAPSGHIANIAFSGGDVVLATLCRDSGLPVTPGQTSDFVEVDGVRIARSDGRRLSVRPKIDVLIDEARDIPSSNLVLATVRDARARDTAAAFFAAGGREMVEVDDRPGMVVLRTLAQLANAAGDAVIDEVASVEAIDEAMVFGANHPEGPLAWLERVGRSRVRNVLANIASETGDALYEPSAYLN
jgi:3-hydroxybutyryl-CoA dehydrogenase